MGLADDPESSDRDCIVTHYQGMKAVTIREAKARLNVLVEAAERGDQIVLMRGSKHVAAIVPLSEEDLELAPSLADRKPTGCGEGSNGSAGRVRRSTRPTCAPDIPALWFFSTGGVRWDFLSSSGFSSRLSGRNPRRGS
ncbi:MAG: type II toxin-antitoxin system Phd/YefM family antitoxin [Vicinamibacteria bacterium]